MNTSDVSAFVSDGLLRVHRLLLVLGLKSLPQIRAPPPACGWIEEAPRAAERRNERRKEESTTRATSLLDCGGENHPRRTRAARIARASPVAMHAGEGPFRTKRRPKTRRETRTTTGDKRREAPQRDLFRLRRREPPTRAPRDASALARVRLLARRGRRGVAQKGKKSLRACCLCRAADNKQPILKQQHHSEE